jgi:hypothetical protein
MLTGSLAIATQGQDQPRAKSKMQVTKSTEVKSARVSGNTVAMRTRERFVSGRNTAAIGNRDRVVTRTRDMRTGSRVVTRSSPFRTYGYRTYSYGYPYYSYGYGYPYYGLGVTFGAPYYGYYPYGYYPSDYYSYPSNYSYGYYSYGQPAYGNASVVIQVQTRLARAGYYRGPIDGIMGPGTSYAIRAYERHHGLRVDGVISGSLLRNMGLRY